MDGDKKEIPEWIRKGPCSRLALDADTVLQVTYYSIGVWALDLRVSGHPLISGQELKVEMDQRDSAQRLALMHASASLSHLGMKLLEAATMASTVLEQEVRKATKTMKEAKDHEHVEHS